MNTPPVKTSLSLFSLTYAKQNSFCLTTDSIITIAQYTVSKHVYNIQKAKFQTDASALNTKMVLFPVNIFSFLKTLLEKFLKNSCGLIRRERTNTQTI